MKKQWISLALAVIMVVSMLAGCGTTSTTPTDSPNAPETQAPVSATNSEESEEQKEIIDISIVMCGVNDQPAQEAVIAAANAYSAEKIGVTISFKGYSWGEYNDAVSRMMASKENLDIVWSQGRIAWSSAGAFMDLTDLLPNYPGLTSVMPQMVWDSVNMSGKTYFIPNYKETGTGLSIATPIAVADQVKAAYGIDFNEIQMDSIFDIAALEEYLLACKELGVDYCLPEGMKDWFWLGNVDPVYEVCGALPFVVNKNTGVVSTYFEVPEYKEYVELMQRWNELGIWTEDQAMSDFDANAAVKSGNWGVMSWVNVPNNEFAFEDTYKIPAYVKSVTDNIFNSKSALGSTWSLTSYTEKADACLRWLELLNTDKAYSDLFIFGVEGEQYTREADGRITKIADSGWNNSAWMCCNTWNVSLQSIESPDKYQQYTDFNAMAVASDLLGFHANTDAVATERAAVAAVYTEARNMFSIGLYGADELDDVIARCKAAGSDVVCAELQSQVEAFLGK